MKSAAGLFRRLQHLTKSSYARSVAIRASSAALSLGVSILLARLLGPAEYGKYGILLSFATILAIPFTAGLPRTIARDIAVARVEQDPGRIRLIIRAGLTTFIGLIPIVFLIAFSLWLAGYEIAGLATGVLVSAALAPVLSADSNRMAVMRGLGSAISSQIPDMLVRPLGTGIIVLVLLSTQGSATAITGMIAYSASTLIGFLVGTFMVRERLREVPRESPREHPNRKVFFSSVFTMSLLGSSNILTTNLDMLLINHLSTHSAAGVYKVALAGLAVVVLGGTAVAWVAYTRLAEAVPTGDRKIIAKHSDHALKWNILFTGAAMLAVLAIGKPVIQLLYGENYSGVWPILIILGTGFFISYLFGPGADIASLAGAQSIAAACVLIGSATTIAVSVLTSPNLGVLGIALGSMVGNILRALLISIVIRVKFNLDITIVGSVRRYSERRHATE